MHAERVRGTSFLVASESHEQTRNCRGLIKGTPPSTCMPSTASGRLTPVSTTKVMGEFDSDDLVTETTH